MIIIHEDIQSCGADGTLPTYNSEGFQIGYHLSSTVGKEFVHYDNSLNSIPGLETFSFFWFYALFAIQKIMRLKFRIIYFCKII